MNTTVVLLVDDEVPFVEAMTRRLTRRNLSILKAYTGEEALERLLEHKNVDIVILDLKMPGADGIQILREIKKDHPLVEVIVLTGHGTVETGIDAMRLGAFDYLSKPCDIDHLTVKIQEAKSQKRKREEKITQARIKEIAGQRAE